LSFELNQKEFSLINHYGLAIVLLVTIHLDEFGENWQLCHCILHGIGFRHLNHDGKKAADDSQLHIK